MNKGFAFLNDKTVSVEEARLDVFDRGLLYGDGLYETIRVRNGCCIRFAQHFDRLTRGSAVLKIEDPLHGLNLEGAILDTLEANELRDARVRVTVTRGQRVGGRPTVIVTAVPLPDHGLDRTKVIISRYRRDETSPLTGVKALNCLASVMAGIEAQDSGADDAILLNTRGSVAEGTTANVFALKDSRLTTPSLDQGCLGGTTRATVLQLAPKLGLEAVEGRVHPDELLEADEVFLTSAIKLARPIVAVDGKAIGRREPEACARIREALLRDE